jgi:protein involved in ribonucleotide reduction
MVLNGRSGTREARNGIGNVRVGMVRDRVAVQKRFVIVVGALGEGVAENAQKQVFGVVVHF